MQSFTFYNPTKIIFGAGTLAQVGQEARAVGHKCLWLYGLESIKHNGVYDTVHDALREAGVEAIELGGVRPNPVLSHARQGVALCREHQVDFVLAVGGGSVIDEAKAIAAAAINECDVWDLFTGACTPETALPLLVVQTNPATGSEMNCGLVLTHDETRDKFGLFCPPTFPKVSILDPAITHSIPANVTACSGVDSMAHALEGYFTHQDPWAPVQERYVEGLVRSIMECMDRLMANPADAEARATFMWASPLCWNGMQSTGLGAVALPSHMLEHPLSGLYDIAHGAGLAIIMPAWMAWAARTNPKPIARFARNILGLGQNGQDDAAVAAEGIDALKAWIKKLGLPNTLTEAGIPVNEIDSKVVPAADILNRAWGVNYDKATLAEIYHSCV